MVKKHWQILKSSHSHRALQTKNYQFTISVASRLLTEENGFGDVILDHDRAEGGQRTLESKEDDAAASVCCG